MSALIGESFPPEKGKSIIFKISAQDFFLFFWGSKNPENLKFFGFQKLHEKWIQRSGNKANTRFIFKYLFLSPRL